MKDARPTSEAELQPVNRSTASLFPWVLGVTIAVAVGYLFRNLLFPALLGTLLAYLLNPLVTWAQGYGIRRNVAVIGLFGGVGAILVSTGIFLAPRFHAEIVDLASSLPSLTLRLESGVNHAAAEIRAAYPALNRFISVQKEEGWLERFIEDRVGGTADLVARADTIVLPVVLVPLFAFFLLRDGRRIIEFLIDRLHPAHIETSVAVWCEVDRMIGRYLRGLAIDAIVIGLISTMGLWAIGVPLPLLLGAFTAVVNPLPYLGTVLAVVLSGAVALAYGHGLAMIAWIVGLYAVIRLLDDFVVSVVTIGGSLHLHPMLMLASIIAGENAFGFLGMVIAVPLVTVVKESARLILEHRRNLTRPHLPLPGSPLDTPSYVC